MVPSSASIAGPNFVLNTITSEILGQIADRLEKASNFDAEVQKLLQEIVKEHKKVIFNGNGYSDEWVEEASKRGLPNIKSTVDAIKALKSEKNISVLEKHGVLSRAECESRYEINLEHYIKTINIEALTTLEMAKRQILPACFKFATELATSINSIKATGVNADTSAQASLLSEISALTASLKKNIEILEKKTEEAANMHGDSYKHASFYRDEVFTQMNVLRADADKLESLVDEDFWPIPTYGDMLFNV